MLCKWCNINFVPVYEFNDYYCSACFYNGIINKEVEFCIDCDIFINIIKGDTSHSTHLLATQYNCRNIACKKYPYLLQYDIVFGLTMTQLYPNN